MWHHNHEQILREWKAKCFVNMWLNTASSYYYAKVHDILTYPVIIFSSITSATLFTGTHTDFVKYLVSALTLLTGILTVVMRQMRPGELYQEYSNIAKRYRALIRLIDTCLELPVELRILPDNFIEKVNSEMNVLNSSQLLPPLYVIRVFEKKFGSIDEKMFGEDIIELIQNELETRKMVRKLKSKL